MCRFHIYLFVAHSFDSGIAKNSDLRLAENLISIDNLSLTEARDPALTSMHFEIINNLHTADMDFKSLMNLLHIPETIKFSIRHNGGT